MSLNEMLGTGSVALDVPCADWREAVRESGRLLVASGVTTDDYTDQMVDTVERLGPYIVIAPGLALAHARPSDAVLRTGMSWLRPEAPVEFGHRSNDPVTLVVGLAALDHEKHQAALVQLATIFADEARRKELAEVPDEDTLRTLLAATE